MLVSCLTVLVLALAVAQSTVADDAGDILERLHQTYVSVNNAFFRGHEGFTVSGTDCRVDVPFELTWTTSPGNSNQTRPESIYPSVHLSKPELTKPCSDVSSLAGGFPLQQPGPTSAM
jgi:hypothetical protein